MLGYTGEVLAYCVVAWATLGAKSVYELQAYAPDKTAREYSGSSSMSERSAVCGANGNFGRLFGTATFEEFFEKAAREARTHSMRLSMACALAVLPSGHAMPKGLKAALLHIPILATRRCPA